MELSSPQLKLKIFEEDFERWRINTSLIPMLFTVDTLHD